MDFPASEACVNNYISHNTDVHQNSFYHYKLSRLTAFRFDHAIPCHATIDVDLASIYREDWPCLCFWGHSSSRLVA
jgi:hypothetical protein